MVAREVLLKTKGESRSRVGVVVSVFAVYYFTTELLSVVQCCVKGVTQANKGDKAGAQALQKPVFT